MARSQEKAMSMLNRWVDQKRVAESGVLGVQHTRRIPSETRSIRDCEFFRSQIVRQLTALLSQIQNAAAGEQRIRDMNDEINRLIRSKVAWEMQIKRLGGPDYSRLYLSGEGDGLEVPGQGGYKYFGAASNLPGVRELLEEAQVSSETGKLKRKDLLKDIRTTYYGWNDECDTELVKEEESHTSDFKQALNEVRNSLRGERHVRTLLGDDASEANVAYVIELVNSRADQSQVDKAILQIRKDSVMAKYVKKPAVTPTVSHYERYITPDEG